jgi:DNA end-binding protein Ku
MPQAVWTGAISFGLVSIPVKLYPATEPKDVRFHFYDRSSGKRVRYERVTRLEEAPAFAGEPADEDQPQTAPAEARSRLELPPAFAPPERVVEPADIVRGYQLPTGDLVAVQDDELEALAPSRSRTIDIEEFVDLAEIDPVFFEKSYHVAPGLAAGAVKPYALLLRAMQAAQMVAIGRFVLRTKPHLVAIRPLERTLALETLFFADEVRAPEAVMGPVTAPRVSERELKMAQQLVGSLATEWVPEKHADEYRKELLALLRAKSPEAPPEFDAVERSGTVDDLMAQLKASVEKAKTRSDTMSATRGRGQRSRAAR